MFTPIKNFIARHLIWVLIVVTGTIFLWAYYGQFFWQYVATLLMGIIAEAVALGLSNLAVYVFTNIKFTKSLVAGEDEKVSVTERHGLIITTGLIFLGVHILIATIMAGMYFAQYN